MKEKNWEKALKFFYKAYLSLGVLRLDRKNENIYIQLLFENNSQEMGVIIDTIKTYKAKYYLGDVNNLLYLFLYCGIKNDLNMYKMLFDYYSKMIKESSLIQTDMKCNWVESLGYYLNKEYDKAIQFYEQDIEFSVLSINCLFHFFKYKIYLEQKNYSLAELEKETVKSINSVYRTIIEEE